MIHPIKFIPGCNTPREVSLENASINVRRTLPWLEMSPPSGRPLVIVAGGPSLKDRYHEIWSHRGDVMALNNAYAFLVERDIIPEYFMLLDARPQNLEFVRNPHRETMHYLAAQCDPSVFDALKDYDTTLYLTTLEGIDEVVAGIDKPKHKVAGTVGTVGVKALCLAHALGYKELHLYGYDSSYADSHHAFAQALNDDAKTIEVYLDGKTYVTTPTFAHQASEFCAMAAGMVRMGFSIELHCSGLLPDLVSYSNNAPPLEVREREKYEEVWRHDVYRKHAPGSEHVARAALALGMKAGESLADFGCGTGRGASQFMHLGINVVGIDFASNCLDEYSSVPFIQACLWDMPMMRVDYGFCTDVMEHIPNEKVTAVLEQIAARARSAYFNIATRDDALGALIGKRLHMTVMPAENWKSLLEVHWDSVEMIDADGEVIFVCKHT